MLNKSLFGWGRAVKIVLSH
jgi:hypothetical protein